MEHDLVAFLDKLNAGEPIPQVEPEDLQAALAVLSESKDILDTAESGGLIKALGRREYGITLSALQATSRPSANLLAVARSALAIGILR